jgi:hypothetical protein
VWRTGDVLYYLGLLTAIGSLPVTGIPSALLVVMLRSGDSRYAPLSANFFWIWLVVFLSMLGGGSIVFLYGVSLKTRAYRMAKHDGIDASKY